MKVIQHDIDSLRHQAIQRYLRTRNRIDRRFYRAVVRSVLILLAILLAACTLALLRHPA